MAAKNTKGRGKDIKPPVWEWILAALGVVIVAGVIGSTLYRAMTQETLPPSFEVSVDSINAVSSGFIVAFRVRNSGTQTAAALTIEGSLIKGAESVETSTATLTYAPGNSERQGGLFFTKDPGAFELKIRALGYEKP